MCWAASRDQRHVVIDDQDGQALRRDALEQLMQFELLARIQAGRGLVEQQQGRIGGQRAGNLDQPLMPVGKARDQFVGAGAKADEGQGRHRALVERVFAAWPIRVLPGRSAPITTFSSAVIERNSRMFWKVRPEPCGRALMRRHVGDIGAVEHHPARGRLVEAGQHVQRRGLAGAVRPDQRMNAAASDRDIDIVDGLEAAEMFRKACDFENRCRRRPSPAPVAAPGPRHAPSPWRASARSPG